MFNLEKSINEWKKSLRQNPAFEDGHIAELEANFRDEVEELIRRGKTPEEAFTVALETACPPAKLGTAFIKAHSNRRSGRPSWEPPRFVPALVWNYAKIALRKMRRQKGFSFINIAGLSVGLAAALFILLYVRFELSFDRFHKDLNRIFIVGLSTSTTTGKNLSAGNMPLMGPTIKAQFPQVESAARFSNMGPVQVSFESQAFREEGLLTADNEIFKILDIPFLQGDPARALEQPKTAVLSRTMAKKYFGSADPVGRMIKIDDLDHEITGVVADPRPNSDFKYTIIRSWKTVEMEEHFQVWSPGMRIAMTLVKLAPGADRDAVEKLIQGIPGVYCREELKRMGAVSENFLFPLSRFHRVAFERAELGPSPAMTFVYVFGAVGFLVLLIACLNFMNLATARSAGRASEVGLRKVVGARRNQLLGQFLGESFLTAFLSLAAAVTLVGLALPALNLLAQTRFTVKDLFHPAVLAGAAAFLVLVGFGAGSYPAFVLSSFRPVAVLKGSLKLGARGAGMRKALVVGQFSISIALIAATLIIQAQIGFMKNQPLGFDRNQKLAFNLKRWGLMEASYESLKNEFLRNPAIRSASASSGVPGAMINRTYVFPTGEQREKGQAFRSLRCDADFFKVYGVELVAGRMFDKALATDVNNAQMINETGVKTFGWKSPEEAVGKRIFNQGKPIIGVVKDFHWWGLQRPIEPLLVGYEPELLRTITLTVDTTKLKDVLAFVEAKYRELFPGDAFEWFFVDQNFDRQYRAEERTARLFQVFAGLGIFIACLGLFGLAAFIAEQRTKEIGIRKVLGASSGGLVVLLSSEVARWVLAANLLAWPLAYFAGRMWLRNFAYKTTLGPGVFIASAAIALGIALLTVGGQAWKAASADPVKSLRFE
jgi:putative ABC transport system permease protein